MIPFLNALSIVGAQGRTYEEFAAHLDTIGTLRGWLAFTNWDAEFNYVTTAATPSDTMVGTPDQSVFRGPSGWSTTCRVVQHSLPSLEAFNDQVAQGRKVLLQGMTEVVPAGGYIAHALNGYTSLANSSVLSGRKVYRVLYWFEGQAWQRDPFAGTAPTPYTW